MGERLIDVFTEVMKIFVSMRYFKDFTYSGNGLALDIYDVITIIEDNPNSVEDQKRAMLGLWKEKNAARATPELLRETVQRYFNAETPDGNERRLEDAFLEVSKKFHSADQFIQFALSNQGLSLSLSEVGNIKDNFKSVEEQNLEMLILWKLKKGDLATVNRILQLVDEFLHGLGGSGQGLGSPSPFNLKAREFLTGLMYQTFSHEER